MIPELITGDPMGGYADGIPDPGTTLTGAKQFLKIHGFTKGFGTENTIDKFQDFVNKSVERSDAYAGKETAWKAGGRAAILKHKLIVSGNYGDDLDDIDSDDWFEITKISKYNYFNKLKEIR